MRKINLAIITFFGTGYFKIIPGTFASLFTSIILFYLFKSINSINYFFICCLVIFLIFIYSFYAIQKLKNEFKEIDAKEIVIDEVFGQTIPILFIEYLSFIKFQFFGADLELYIISFFLFRFFDILKPFPINYFDKNYKNSFGIIFDDLLAGIYSSIIIFLVLIVVY